MPPRKHRPLRFDIESLERRDCPAAVAISGDQSLIEAGGPIVLTVSLAAPDRKPVVVGYSLTGDATVGRDYRLAMGGRSLAAPAGSLTFRPGETRKMITVTPLNDALREPTERFTMNLTPLRNAQVTAGTATVTLLDDDNYTASIIGPASVDPGTPAEFTVRLSAPATKTEVIHVSTEAGSASETSDFRPLTRLPLVFNRGETSKSFRVPVLANTADEPDETFFITAQSSDPKFPNITRRIVTIDGDGVAPPPSLSVAPTSVTEGNTASAGITIDWVTIGDVGNAADDTGFGAVNYEFRIGKHEITVGQYVEFLNAVAKSDPYRLYNENMATNLNVAGIVRLGTPGAYVYQVMSNGGASVRNHPVTYVSSFDCVRFANWMHNGQGAGSTENGAYTLVAGQTVGSLPVRNPGAKFFLPTEDEWYKAAYYKGGGTNAGYWEYATRSDIAPDNSVGSSANQANYFTTDYAVTQSAVLSTTQNYLTNVGSFSLSSSAYGTFDQSGNVQELTTQSRLSSDLSGRRGGGWFSPAAFDISSAHSPTIPAWDDGFAIGFRLASAVTAAPNVAPNATASVTAWFTVSLSTPATDEVTVRYDTADGTATEADGDYDAVVNGTLTFAPGETVKSVGVTVRGDTTPESDETFTLILSAPVNATLGTATAVGTIRDDDSGPPPPAQAAWTIMVYMTGEDLNTFARDDVNEMEQFLSTLPANAGVKIVVAWDQPKAGVGQSYATGNGAQAAWRTYGRSVLRADTAATIASSFDTSVGEKNTGDPAVLVDFMKWAAQQAPAANYALQMWGHGGGLSGSQFDSESGGDALTINELVSALGTPGVPPVQIVSYDNCLMGMAEIGYAAATRFTGHFVASEELVPGTGQNYRTAYDALKTSPATVTSAALAAGMVASYQTQYVGAFTGSFAWDTFSAAATGGYGPLISALSQFVTATDPLAAADRTTLRNLATAGPSISFDEASFRDLGKFMTRVATAGTLPQAVRTAATAVGSALTAMISSKTADARSSSGMAIYLPTQADSYLGSYATTASAFASATGWDRFARWMATGNRTATPGPTGAGQQRAKPAGSRAFAENPAAFASISWAAYGADQNHQQAGDARGRGRGVSRFR